MSCFQLCQIKRRSQSWDLRACLEGAWQAAPPHQLLITQLSRSCGKHKMHTAERSYSDNAVECRKLNGIAGGGHIETLEFAQTKLPKPPRDELWLLTQPRRLPRTLQGSCWARFLCWRAENDLQNSLYRMNYSCVVSLSLCLINKKNNWG